MSTKSGQLHVGEIAVDTVAGAVDFVLPGQPVTHLIQLGEEVIETTISIAPTLDEIVETSVNIIETAWDVGTQIIGEIDAFFAGKITVQLNLDVLNRDPSFDVNNRMVRAWGPRVGREIAPHGTKVWILKWGNIPFLPESFNGNMNQRGIATIDVGKGGSARGTSGVCIEMENDAAIIASGITENEFCDFRQAPSFGGFDSDLVDERGSGGRDNSIHLRSNNRELNFLAQSTDGADYLNDVVHFIPHQAEISVGAVANIIADQQAFTGCLDFPSTLPLLDAVTGTVSTLVPTGLFTESLVRRDIFMPDVAHVNDSRGVMTHEYGHFAMCSLFFDESPTALRQAIENRLSDGEIEATDADSRNLRFAVMMETFADFLATQVAGGSNYISFPPLTAFPGVAMEYCTSAGCLEQNFRGTGDSNINRPFDDEIAKYLTIVHDAFDRPTNGWRGNNRPTNADAWFLPAGSSTLVISPTGFQPSIDDGVQLDGNDVKQWVSRTIGDCDPTGEFPDGPECEFTVERAMRGLAETMYADDATWCQVCDLFAQHDAGSLGPTGTGVSQFDLWELCTQPQLANIVGEPPVADLRLNAATCLACGVHQRGDNGTCVACSPGEIARGNQCIPCGPHEVPGANETCIPCAWNEIAVSGQCVACAFGQGADAAANVCRNCPADSTINWASFAEPGCAEALSVPVSAAGDICPQQYWLEVQNANVLAPGSGDRSSISFQVVGTPVEISESACLSSEAELSVFQGSLLFRTAGCFGDYCAPPAPDALEQCYAQCVDPNALEDCRLNCVINSIDSCTERCSYGCPLELSSTEAASLGTLRVNVEFASAAASATVKVWTEEQCGIQ